MDYVHFLLVLLQSRVKMFKKESVPFYFFQYSVNGQGISLQIRTCLAPLVQDIWWYTIFQMNLSIKIIWDAFLSGPNLRLIFKKQSPFSIDLSGFCYSQKAYASCYVPFLNFVYYLLVVFSIFLENMKKIYFLINQSINQSISQNYGIP